MEDMKSEHAFALHRKTAELLDDLKQVGRSNFPPLSSRAFFFTDPCFFLFLLFMFTSPANRSVVSVWFCRIWSVHSSAVRLSIIFVSQLV